MPYLTQSLELKADNTPSLVEAEMNGVLRYGEVPTFIPDKMQTERILDDEDMPANHGSLWRYWSAVLRSSLTRNVSEIFHAVVFFMCIF